MLEGLWAGAVSDCFCGQCGCAAVYVHTDVRAAALFVLHHANADGETGLDGPLGGPVLPPAPHGPLPGKAPVVMFERIAAAHQQLKAAVGVSSSVASGSGGGGLSGGDASGSGSGTEQPRVALVATAALTNVALLLALYPEVKDMIEASNGWCFCLLFWLAVVHALPTLASCGQAQHVHGDWSQCYMACSPHATAACPEPHPSTHPPTFHGPADCDHGRLPGGGQHRSRCVHPCWLPSVGSLQPLCTLCSACWL